MKLKSDRRKLLLFDIDGTLILTGGRGRQALTAAAEAEFQKPIRSKFKDFAGSTDRMIVLEMITNNNVQVSDADASIDRVLARYLELLKPLLVSADTVEVLPGVRELLEVVSRNGEFTLGLVTGNIERGARMKLNPVGLNPFFAFGAFGDDAIDRKLLPGIAWQRAEEIYREKFLPGNIWIIGDTPRDIDCGKSNGLRTLAVATSAWGVDELQTHQPDAALLNLSDTEGVLDIFRN
jgi:phosphoglycolate phosphatase